MAGTAREQAERKRQRQLEREQQRARQRRRMQGITLGTAALIVLLLVVWLGWSAAQRPLPSEGASAGPLDLAGQPFLGSPEAPVQVVEFGDFKCPYCRQFEAAILPELQERYIDTGRIRFYFLNYPFIGPDSWTAATAGEAVFRQRPEAFWEYYRAVYERQGDEREVWATPEFLLELIREEVPGVDVERVRQDLERGAYKDEADRDYRQGERVGVRSVPAIVVNGVLLESYSLAAIEEAIAAAADRASDGPAERAR